MSSLPPNNDDASSIERPDQAGPLAADVNEIAKAISGMETESVADADAGTVEAGTVEDDAILVGLQPPARSNAAIPGGSAEADSDQTSRHFPVIVPASGFEAVTRNTFAKIGLPDSETRVFSIRNAARRTASRILAAARDAKFNAEVAGRPKEPPGAPGGPTEASNSGVAANERRESSVDMVASLADIAWTTYQLIDPRYRVIPAQQIRVGRILPLSLNHAAVLDLPGSRDFGEPNPADSIHSHSESVDPNATPILFGHRLPVVALPVGNGPATDPSATTAIRNDTLGSPIVSSAISGQTNSKPSGRISPRVVDSGKANSEAAQAYAELRSLSPQKVWAGFIHDTRLLAAFVAAAATAGVMLWFFASRHWAPTNEVIAQQTKLQQKGAAPEIPEAHGIPQTRGSSKPGSSTESGSSSESKSPAESTESPELALPPTPKAPVASVLDAELKPAMRENIATSPERPVADAGRAEKTEETETAQPPQKPLVGPPIDAVLLKITPVGLPSGALDDSSVDLQPIVNPVPAMNAAPANTPELAMNPKSPVAAIPWDSDEVESAVSEIWDRTPSAGRRFTTSTAAELIDQWDFDAELAGYGSVEHAAARSLALRAAWLIEPFAKLVDRIREQGPIRDLPSTGPGFNPSVAQPGPRIDDREQCCHLTFSELRMLARSWKDARGRVVVSDDLDQLLHQANVLTDRMLVSDLITPFERSDLIEKMSIDIERLSRIARDKTVIAESEQLAEALKAFPQASELQRLETAEQPSGFLGSIRCLKQRQWENGLQWLTHASEPAIASCAKAEWELDGSENASTDQRVELATRWSKVAARLPEREAASIRLHAIQLYGDSEQYAEQRNELKKALPGYLAPLAGN